MQIARLIALAAAMLVLADTRTAVNMRRDLEVRFGGDGVTLAGTLGVPAGRTRSPVAVFVTGDGPQDRHGRPGGSGLFDALAESLLARGIAVLRHDDRGAGGSSTPAGPPSYRALLGDTRAAIAFVRGRTECDGRRVFLMGHSEGSKTCAVLAAEDTALAGIALLAGATAVNVDTLLEEQARLDPHGPATRLLTTLARARAGARARGPGDLVEWMREHLEVAPRAMLPRIRCPVLILQGEADSLVRAHHAAEAAALIERGGNRRVTLRLFAGLSHVFDHRVPGTGGSPGTSRVDPNVPATLARWMAATASR